MGKNQGINVAIYKIDADAVHEFFGGDLELADMPARLVSQYNTDKGSVVYGREGQREISGCKFDLYRNVAVRPNTSGWVKFFSGTGIELGNLQNQLQHLVCFVVVDDQLYAYTAGQSAVVFERFVDVSFPIAVGRRIAKPELVAARANQITGSTLASDIHFRDPRRITSVESLDTVWSALSGQLRSDVLKEKELVSIYGEKKRIRVDIKSSVRIGPALESPAKTIELIRWLEAKAEETPPVDDGLAVLDSIKALSPRTRKGLIAELRRALAEQLFVAKDVSGLALTHADASLYNNADKYVATQARVQDPIYEDADRPSLEDVVGAMEIDEDDLEANFKSVRIQSSYDDFGPGLGTSGTLDSHLYGELSYKGKTYFMLAGKWLEVDADYVEQVTKDFVAIMSARDIAHAELGMAKWSKFDAEGSYNEKLIDPTTSINGDKVLTDNVELFDTIIIGDDEIRIVHVKRHFDVKVRDARSQLINSAQMIENDLRTDRSKLKKHHAALVRNKRTTMPEADFLALFDKRRHYVLAYGTEVKVTEATLQQFKSYVARMEIVALNNQFNQLGGTGSRMSIAWIPIE